MYIHNAYTYTYTDTYTYTYADTYTYAYTDTYTYAYPCVCGGEGARVKDSVDSAKVVHSSADFPNLYASTVDHWPTAKQHELESEDGELSYTHVPPNTASKPQVI